jgi:hypothetical protein
MFVVFLSRFIHGFKVSKSANTGKIFFFLNSIWVSKSTEFHADLESVEKVS